MIFFNPTKYDQYLNHKKNDGDPLLDQPNLNNTGYFSNFSSIQWLSGKTIKTALIETFKMSTIFLGAIEANVLLSDKATSLIGFDPAGKMIEFAGSMFMGVAFSSLHLLSPGTVAEKIKNMSKAAFHSTLGAGIGGLFGLGIEQILTRNLPYSAEYTAFLGIGMLYGAIFGNNATIVGYKAAFKHLLWGIAASVVMSPLGVFPAIIGGWHAMNVSIHGKAALAGAALSAVSYPLPDVEFLNQDLHSLIMVAGGMLPVIMDFTRMQLVREQYV